MNLWSYTIENYPGFKQVSGTDLADLMQQQAEELGAEIDEFDMVERVDFSGDEKIVEKKGNAIIACCFKIT